MNKLDARGRSCPEPVMMLRNAMASQEESYEIIVDNHASKENITRYAEHAGYRVEVSENEGEYALIIRKITL